MKKPHLLFLLIILPLLYFSHSALAGICHDDIDCAADEICNINGFCEFVGGDGDGGAECIDDTDCLNDEICDVDGFCVPVGGDGDGDVVVEDSGCSILPRGHASKSHYVPFAAYLLALGGITIRRRLSKEG